MLGYREAKAHAIIAAVIMWTAAAVVTLGGAEGRYITGRLKAGDFVQIYTLAHVAFEGPFPSLADPDRFYDRQLQLVPESEGDQYLPVYPPTAALLFRPLALLPYSWALRSWIALTFAGYGLAVWLCWRSARDVFPDATLVAAAAAAFPPFWALVLFGQVTVVMLIAVLLAGIALRSGRPIAAGLALSLLSVKPQFAIVIAIVLLVAAEWRILLGGVLGSAAQLLAVAFTLGSQALIAYAETLRRMPQLESLLEPKPWQMHSLRSLTNLLPGAASALCWIALSFAIVVLSLRIWRSRIPVLARLGALILATVLVNPHLFVYDLSILALVILWIGEWLQRQRPESTRWFWQSVYLLYVLTLLPTAVLLKVQTSVLLMIYMFWRLSRASQSPAPELRASPGAA